MPKYCPSCRSELLNPDAVACPTCGDAIRGNSFNAGNNYPEIKNLGLVAVLSFFITGLGKIYNGQHRSHKLTLNYQT
jgi:hypothetical protein